MGFCLWAVSVYSWRSGGDLGIVVIGLERKGGDGFEGVY